MRLVDADALKEAMYQNGGCGICSMYVDDAPTIDAIPMWWITEKFLDVLNKDKELSKAVWMVRNTWQKEQEANQ